ncbi:hypothetical protein BDR26DRAFT_858218 [Obelidium mucronatum]|nr:hypothetical protein BDR26DRAFT_858218 [Obelidium mucronatum]
MIAFGWFLLYKCWMVSSQNRIVFVLGALLLANRWAWTITDLAFARLDCSSAGGCMYTENLTTIIGSQVSDVAIDIFCTMAVLIGCQYHLRSDIRGLFLVIMEENGEFNI